MTVLLRFAFIAVLALVVVFASDVSHAAGTGAGEKLAKRFRDADTDRNGVLSRSEAAALPEIAGKFDAVDVDHDGRISAEEIRAFRRAGRRSARDATEMRRGAGKFEAYFALADTDGDGVLTRAEAERSLPRIAAKFARIDSDADGRLTMEELRVWFAARRVARQGDSRRGEVKPGARGG
jgi:Ca2+-binding EF-hand superfamily protein